jgi:hypothetical protein
MIKIFSIRIITTTCQDCGFACTGQHNTEDIICPVCKCDNIDFLIHMEQPICTSKHGLPNAGDLL